MHEILEMHKLHKQDERVHNCRCADMTLAEAYVREQPLDCVFPPEEGLVMGTAFPNLSRPYNGWRKVAPC